MMAYKMALLCVLTRSRGIIGVWGNWTYHTLSTPSFCGSATVLIAIHVQTTKREKVQKVKFNRKSREEGLKNLQFIAIKFASNAAPFSICSNALCLYLVSKNWKKHTHTHTQSCDNDSKKASGEKSIIIYASQSSRLLLLLDTKSQPHVHCVFLSSTSDLSLLLHLSG